MATRLLSRTTTKSLCKTLHHHFQHSSSSLVQLLRNAHVLGYSPFDSTKFLYRNSRGMVCAPNYDISSLNLDNRVPATVITGFLGSGKVGFVCIFGTKWVCLFLSKMFPDILFLNLFLARNASENSQCRAFFFCFFFCCCCFVLVLINGFFLFLWKYFWAFSTIYFN